MKRSLKYTLSLVILLAGCKKNNLPPSDNGSEPVFYVKGEINGAPLQVQAGVNNYFMYSSHYQQANNVYVYKADLKQSSCNGNCGYGITILINDDKVSPANGPLTGDSTALHTGHYEINDGDLPPLGFNGYFTPTYVDPGTTYTWTYSDGVVQSGQGGQHYFNNKQTYSVALTIANGGCVQTHTNEFRVGSPLQANISAMCNWSQTPTTYSFTPYLSPTAGQGITYEWDFNDASPSATMATPTHTYSYGSKYYRARLRLTNNNHDTCYSFYQVPVSITTPTCHANFNSAFLPVVNTLSLSAITVLVTDPSGNVYSSESAGQVASNSVEIVSVEEYKNNEHNEPTKKLKLRFNCTVKNGSSALNITNGEAVIAVSHD